MFGSRHFCACAGILLFSNLVCATEPGRRQLGPKRGHSERGHIDLWRTQLDATLLSWETSYSETHHMLGMPFESPGYHSQVAQGTWVHPTRDSLGYAVLLTSRGLPADLSRAEQVIRKVLSLQVTDPDHAYYGIWPWLLEESVDEMAPPDRNWADFLGAQLALLLKQHSQQFPDDLVAAMRISLRHAAVEIRQRDVKPGYTNIAIMGGGVCVAAGELLTDESLLEYGRGRLQRCVAHAGQHGSFNEYNSPIYTRVALYEAERILQLVTDDASRAAAESLRRIAWQIMADSFHPGTGQWAGPHSRGYFNYLSGGMADYLERQAGAKTVMRQSDDDKPAIVDAIRHLPCPPELRQRFQQLPSDPLELRRTFIRKATPDESTSGTTWFSADACLGSVNQSMLWTQRRTLLGYWMIEPEQVACFRQRFLHDGEDFASMGVRNEQRGPRVLTLFEPLRRHGSWHPSLDRPEDGIFTANDFRIRYELLGKNASARQLGDRQFELRAGNHRVVVHVLPGRFAGQTVRWSCQTRDDSAVVDGVCYAGSPHRFNFKTLNDVAVVTGVELLGTVDRPSGSPEMVTSPTPSGKVTQIEATWDVGEAKLRVAR